MFVCHFRIPLPVAPFSVDALMRILLLLPAYRIFYLRLIKRHLVADPNTAALHNRKYENGVLWQNMKECTRICALGPAHTWAGVLLLLILHTLETRKNISKKLDVFGGVFSFLLPHCHLRWLPWTFFTCSRNVDTYSKS